MRKGVPGMLPLVSSLLYACAAAIGLLVIALCLPLGAFRPFAVVLQSALSGIVPNPLRGVLVVATPLGGAFRGDFALFAVVLATCGSLLSHAVPNPGR